MTKRKNDSQRNRLYQAENVLSTFDKKMSEDEIRNLYKLILSHSDVLKKYGHSKRKDLLNWSPVIHISARRRGAVASIWRVSFGKRCMTLHYALHELAHVIIKNHEERYNIAHEERDPGHGWKYAECFVFLVETFMGKDEASALRKAFKEKNVKFKAPQKRKPLSDAQKAVLCERLKRARDVKNSKSIEPCK